MRSLRGSRVAVALVVAALAGSALAQTGTTFTYQGQLRNAGVPISGNIDVRFNIFGSETGTGPALAAPVTSLNVPVTDGLFSTTVDFGAGPFATATPIFLAIEVRSPAGVGSFVPLAQRQQLTASPTSLRTRGLNVSSTNDVFLTTQFGGTRVLGMPQGPSTGTNLIVQAGGTLTAEPSSQAGGNLFLRGGNSNTTASGSPPVGTSVGGDVVLQAGENTSSAANGDRFPGNIRFVAGDSGIQPIGNQPERMRILGDNGFVGIGTANPLSLLDVRTATNPAITVGSPTGTLGSLFLGNSGHGLARNFAANANDVGLFTTGGNLRFSANGTATTQMTLSGGGNLGIGSANPLARIDIGNGRVRINDGGNAGTQGFMSLHRDDGRITAMLTNLSTGYVLGVVNNAATIIHGGVQTNYTTDQSNVFASTKTFVEPNPRDPSTDIYYTSLEGPEAGMYMRGTATLVNGQATITMPAHFSDLASAHGVTVQVTPLSADSMGLAVVAKSNTGFQVRELMRGNGTYQFDWEIKAARKQHLDYQVLRPWTNLRVQNPNISDAEAWRLRQQQVERSNARAAALEAAAGLNNR